MELVREYWLVILVAIVVIVLAAFILMRPKQRVQLSQNSAPIRPHMAHASRPMTEGRGIAAEAAAAVSDVGGQIIGAPIHENLPGASGPPDDLTRLKGVGPKFAAILNQYGIRRFDQLARLSDADIDGLDEQLGAFSGRLRRDQIPLQADYLARGDEDGFEERFGKL